VVSSGAVGLGVQHLGLEKRPTDLPMIQACAAVGQGILVSMYADAFAKLGIKTAQVLLGEEDFSNRRRYLNLRSTITELIKLRVLPIINENDTVSTTELESRTGSAERKVNFGDNDKLSALVASKIDADLLVILTDVDGLFSDDPRTNPDAYLIETVSDVSPYLVAEPSPDKKKPKKDGPPKKAAHSQGRGGIRSKVEAAGVVTKVGCSCIVANGKTDHILDKIFQEQKQGTLFLPQKPMTGRSRWIAFATSVEGSLSVNAGAREALEKRKASLLPAGVVSVNGTFARGDVVSIKDENGNEFARGLANYNSDETKLISGKHSNAIDQLIEQRNYDAIVTRDNIAFTSTV
ncbi:MAG: glutamate 5-kinase, partial [Cyanobacteria bacterium]|nr:glutamate 5-kinase [Cyanobacteriota bacterium]